MNAPTKMKAETLSAAMALAFAEIEKATKGAVNPHFKSKYADLGAVIEAIKPALINEHEPLLKAETDGTVIAVDERGGPGGFVVTVTPAVAARKAFND